MRLCAASAWGFQARGGLSLVANKQRGGRWAWPGIARHTLLFTAPASVAVPADCVPGTLPPPPESQFAELAEHIAKQVAGSAEPDRDLHPGRRRLHSEAVLKHTSTRRSVLPRKRLRSLNASWQEGQLLLYP